MFLQSFELKSNPSLKQVVLAAFPSYRKTKVWVSTFSENGQNINSYWDGGSRDEFAIVELSTMQRKNLPTSTHPYFDVSARGLAGQDSPVISTDHAGNVTLKVLPEGFVLVSAGTFCGKTATAKIYVNSANMPRLLAA
jgi:hypothetical protein